MIEVAPLLVDALAERPVLVVLIVLMLLFVLGVYFMLRRTLLAFTEGMREGQNKR